MYILASTGTGCNEAVLPSSLAQRLADSRDLLSEVRIFDEAVRPQGLHQFVF